MTPQGIVSAIVDVLKNDPTLASYVPASSILEGMRDNIITFPTLWVDSGGDRVIEQNYPYEKLNQDIRIAGFIVAYDKEHQLTGDKALFQLKNDVKRALSLNSTFGLVDVYTSICQSSVDAVIDYPMRGFEITVEVTYRQNRLTRA